MCKLVWTYSALFLKFKVGNTAGLCVFCVRKLYVLLKEHLSSTERSTTDNIICCHLVCYILYHGGTTQMWLQCSYVRGDKKGALNPNLLPFQSLRNNCSISYFELTYCHIFRSIYSSNKKEQIFSILFNLKKMLLISSPLNSCFCHEQIQDPVMLCNITHYGTFYKVQHSLRSMS